MSAEKLFTPLKVGAVTAPNRVFMAPLTRLRSIEPGDIPTPLMGEYYRRRAFTARNRSPHGRKLPRAFTLKRVALRSSCGIPAVSLTIAFSLAARLRFPLRL